MQVVKLLVADTKGELQEHALVVARAAIHYWLLVQLFAHLIRCFYGCALNANLSLAVSLLLLKSTGADLTRQNLSTNVVLLGKAQANLHET